MFELIEYERINGIETVIETFLDMIHKNEAFIEAGYINNEGYDQFVNEMFQLYMEATDRRKRADAIDAWMRDNHYDRKMSPDGGFVSKTKNLPNGAKGLVIASGDNYQLSPEELAQLNYQFGSNDASDGKTVYKKDTDKRNRRMRNFLLQHNFDPQTGTIDSQTIDPKTGKPIRIRFNTNEDNVNNPYYMPSYRAGVMPIISMGVRDLKGPQPGTQLDYGHENGHHNSNVAGGGGKDDANFKNKQLPPNDPANQHLQNARNAGVYVNQHDADSEELHADLFGANNARIRTKYAGSKRAVKNSGATRNANAMNIDKWMKNLSNYLLTDINGYIRNIQSEIGEFVKMKQFITQSLTSGGFNQTGAIQDSDTIRRIIQQLQNPNDQKYTKLKNAMTKAEYSLNNPPFMFKDDQEYINGLKQELSNAKTEFDNYMKQLSTLGQMIPISPDDILVMLNKNTYPQQLQTIFNQRKPDLEKLLGFIDNFIKTNTDYVKQLQLHGKNIMESSTKIRRDFVMKQKNMINEYFTNFFNEYYNIGRLCE